jgi:hypothetical protein
MRNLTGAGCATRGLTGRHNGHRVVSQTFIGVLLATGALCGVVGACRSELRRDYHARYERWNEAPGSFVAAFSNAALLGAGTGMAFALVALVMSALMGALPEFR